MTDNTVPVEDQTSLETEGLIKTRLQLMIAQTHLLELMAKDINNEKFSQIMELMEEASAELYGLTSGK